MVEPFLESDIVPFLAMAKEEGWICDRWELEFLLQSFPGGCFVCREQGSARGYITSVRYRSSGWIGNLLVHPEARRHGIGRGLMELTVSALLKSGAETIWLTASENGVDLYRKLGFVPIDQINRWTGKGLLNHDSSPFPPDLELVREVDRAGWGDRRDSLLQVTCGRGRLFTSSGGFVCRQSWDHGTQIGPWGCLIGTHASELLDQALSGAGERVFLDVPAGNRAATEVLKKRGFSIKGSNTLMYLGDEPRYEPKNIFSLGSMGSMG